MLAALLIALSLVPSADPAPAAPREGTVTTRDGLTLRYRRHGTGPQAAVVPLGFILEADLERLASPKRSLVFYDQRNRGRSDTAPPERSALADEIADLETLRQALGLERITTIGYSYLGLMTVMYAMEFPARVERLVQLGPVPRKFGTVYPAHLRNDDRAQATDEREELERLRREGMHEKEPRAYCEREWLATRHWLVGDPSRAAALGPGHCDLPNEWPTHLGALWRTRMVEMQALDLPLDRIARVRQPVLTVHGTKDRNAPYGAGREWATILPNARLLTVPGAAHQSWTDRPELVLGAIEEFLQGRWPKAAERVR